ncbi:MAG: hypothetical protein TH68_05920, partial [Candidatus Synechococcus spongiarum 142]
VAVTDNDTPNLVVSTEAVTVAEAGSAIYMVRLAKQPTDAVTVTVLGMGNGVSVDTDGGMQGQQASLSFTTGNWNAEQTVTVSAADDDNTIFETVTLTHTADGGGYDAVSQALVVVNVTDDDTGSLVVSPEAVTVAEKGSATYTVKLATEPTDGVMVTVQGMGNGVSVDTDRRRGGQQTSLGFTTSNWDRWQTVTVWAAADDNIVFETVTLAHSAVGGGYDAVNQALVVVTVTDDDTAGLVVSAETVNVVEEDSATYTVKLATPPTGAVTVTVGGMGSGVSVDTDS